MYVYLHVFGTIGIVKVKVVKIYVKNTLSLFYNYIKTADFFYRKSQIRKLSTNSKFMQK